MGDQEQKREEKCCEMCGFNSARGQDSGCRGCPCHSPQKEGDLIFKSNDRSNDRKYPILRFPSSGSGAISTNPVARLEIVSSKEDCTCEQKIKELGLDFSNPNERMRVTARSGTWVNGHCMETCERAKPSQTLSREENYYGGTRFPSSVCPSVNLKVVKPSPSQQKWEIDIMELLEQPYVTHLRVRDFIKEILSTQEKTLREELGKGKLEEAIEKCEELPYFELSKSPDSKWCGITKNVTEYGSTPLEAVQNLLLAIKGEK